MKKLVKKRQLVRRRSKKSGLPPGTLIHLGEKKVEQVRISFIDYDEQNIQERQVSKIEECFPLKPTPTVSWINIDGLHEVEILETIGKQFELHPLMLEDILNTDKRPKHEGFDKHIFIVLRMLSFDEETQAIESEQISLVLGQNFVIAFQERIGE